MQVGVGGDFKICIGGEQYFYLSNDSFDNLDKS